jgi:hypothetical protein
MKSLLILLISLVLIALTVSFIHKSSNQNNVQSIAVVELFTSQGCSSCPPADALLHSLIQNSKSEDRTVYGLSFHVDYWNHLGWKDPYSQKEFAERQRHYAQIFNLSSVYTPQMIVNGKKEFTGSSKSKAGQAIYHVSLTPSMGLTGMVKKDMQELLVHYTLTGSPAKFVLNAALVESDLQNTIKRGENSGKTLYHDNVVRAFTTVPLQSEGDLTLSLPKAVNLDKSSVILYIQDKETWEVAEALQLQVIR